DSQRYGSHSTQSRSLSRFGIVQRSGPRASAPRREVQYTVVYGQHIDGIAVDQSPHHAHVAAKGAAAEKPHEAPGAQPFEGLDYAARTQHIVDCKQRTRAERRLRGALSAYSIM